MTKKETRFQKIKRIRKDYKNINNLIDIISFKFDRENHFYEWAMGIAIVLFLSVSLNDILNTPNKFIHNLGFWGYIITITIIFLSVGVYKWVNSKQSEIMEWLYKEKDKKIKIKNP